MSWLGYHTSFMKAAQTKNITNVKDAVMSDGRKYGYDAQNPP